MEIRVTNNVALIGRSMVYTGLLKMTRPYIGLF